MGKQGQPQQPQCQCNLSQHEEGCNVGHSQLSQKMGRTPQLKADAAVIVGAFVVAVPGDQVKGDKSSQNYAQAQSQNEQLFENRLTHWLFLPFALYQNSGRAVITA